MVKIFAVIAGLMMTGSVAWAGDNRLSGSDIQGLFEGSSMYGHFLENGAKWGERTTRDGRVLDLLKGAKNAGAWAVDDDQICYVYFGRPSSHVCYKIGLSGLDVNFFDVKTGTLTARATRVIHGHK